MRIRVDRDSVAMGDDVESHERVVVVPDDATLDQLFRRTAPDVSVSGGSTWICTWNGVPVAVQSSGWRTGKVWDDRYATPADLPGGTTDPVLVHLYWTQVDAGWLLDQLRGGAPLDRRSLGALWAPIAADQHERSLRERERTTTDRLLDPRTVAALEGCGARIDLHTDRTCRFVLDAGVVAPGREAAAGTWTVERSDSMTIIRDPRRRVGSLRPVSLAPGWILALVGDAVTGRGADALPPPVVESELRRSPSLWTVTRQVGARQDLAQLPDEAHAQWFRRTLGRDADEVAAAYGLRLPAEAPQAGHPPEPARAGGRLGRWARRLFGPGAEAAPQPAPVPTSPAPTSPVPTSPVPTASAQAAPVSQPAPAAAPPAHEPVDLPVPEELWARWSAFAAALACLGVDDVYWADASGAHHDDHGGSQSHLVLGPGGGAVLYGWDRDQGIMTRDHPPLALLPGAPDWSPFAHLHELAAELTLGFVTWYDPASGWRRVVDPPGGDGAFTVVLDSVLTASRADLELQEVQTEWAEAYPEGPAEEAAAAAARGPLLAAARAGAVDGELLRALWPHLDAERVDVTAGLAAASCCGITPGSTLPRAVRRG